MGAPYAGLGGSFDSDEAVDRPALVLDDAPDRPALEVDDVADSFKIAPRISFKDAFIMSPKLGGG